MKMFILLPLIAFALVSNGQVIFGPELGVGLGSTRYADPSNPAPPTTFFTTTYGVSMWTIQPSPVNLMVGIRYVESKNNFHTSLFDESAVTRELRNKYISIPARITFDIAKFGTNQTISLYVGPDLSYWLKGTVSLTDNENNQKLLRKDVDFSERGLERSFLQRMQVGYQAGATFLHRSGLSNWAISLQYTHGLSKHYFGKITYAEIPGVVDDYAFRNEMLTLNTTYYLDPASKKRIRARNRQKHVRAYWKTDL